MLWISLLFQMGCESDKAVTVFNSPPDADIISHDNGSEVFEGYPVEFRAALSDVNHDTDQLTARWKVNGEEVCPFLPPDQAGESVCVATINTGDEEVMVEVRDPDNASGGEAINLSIVPTEAPTAEILKPLEDGVFYSDYPITFEGMIADAEDDVSELVYEWSSSIDGVIDVNTTVESDGSMLGSAYLSEEIHFITLRVEDTTGKTSTASTTITVGGPNNDPTCEITSPVTNTAGPTGELVTFTGTVDDADIPESMLSVTWSSDKDGEIGTSTPETSGNVIFPFADLSINTHVISMTVLDEKGAECVSNVVYSVSTPPSVTIDSPTSGTYNEGETITFAATVSDNEDQPNEIALEWTTSDGTVLNSQSATSDGTAEFVLSDMVYGQQVVTLTGTDTDGLTASDLVSFTINALPTQPSLTVLPENPKTGDDITATATGSTDADGGNVTYAYEWVYGSNTVNGSTLSSSETAKGQEWTVTATPNDGTADGPSVSQSVTIGNTAPDSLVVTVTPNSGIYNDSELTCSAIANDVDSSDTLVYSYEWSTGATTETITLDGSLNPTESVTCTATVTDGTDSISDSSSVTLDNRDPVLSNLAIEADGELWNGTTLTCSADVTDADGETPEATYSWTLADGTTIVDGNTLTLENVSDGDVFTCTASVEDGYNGTDTLLDSITTTNTPPVVDFISVTPDSVQAGEHTFSCSVETSDTDADDVDVSYEWTINGTPQQEESNMLSGSFTLGMVIACNATPNDGKEDGNVVFDDVTIENAKPVVDSVTLSPETVYTNDTITATAVLSDADTSQSGDLTASYSWHVVDLDGNDVEVQSGTDNTLSGVSHFSRDEEVYVVVTPNDGVEDGPSLTSVPVSISNTAPVLSSVTVTPDPATAGQDDLTCAAVATDADGDAILYTYEWSDSTGLRQDMIEVADTSDEYLAAGLEEDTWTCDVTPYDGTDYGSVLSDSVTVESGCSSFYFAGTNQSVSTDVDAFSNSELQQGTLSSWVKIDGAPSSHMTIFSVEGWLWLGVETDGRLSGCSDGICARAYSSSLIDDNEWHFITVTWDSSITQVFVDGVLEGTSNPSGTPNADAYSNKMASAGGNVATTSSTPSFEGIIHDVSMWTTMLSEQEQINYMNEVGIEPDLFWWSFQSISTGFILDQVGNKDGTIYGATLNSTCPEEDLDGDGVAAWEDCDDGDASIYPFAGDTYGDGIDSDCDGLDCEAASDGNTYFAACGYQATSNEADSLCIDAGYDGLATIQNGTESSFVVDLFTNQTPNWMIGLVDSTGNNNWYWRSGLGLSYTNWASGQPQSNSGRDCGFMSSPNNGTWFNDSCTTSSNDGGIFGRICEKR